MDQMKRDWEINSVFMNCVNKFYMQKRIEDPGAYTSTMRNIGINSSDRCRVRK